MCLPTDVNGGYGKEVREYVITAIPLDFFDAFYDLEEKLGLIVKVIRNKLEQPLGYQVQVGKDVLYFRSVLAEKYFRVRYDEFLRIGEIVKGEFTFYAPRRLIEPMGFL
jgi:hypothetical protein